MKKFVSLGMAVLITASTPVIAKPGQGQGEGKHDEKGSQQPHKNRDVRDERVGSNDAGRYYAANGQGNCPPGLAKKGSSCLPPG